MAAVEDVVLVEDEVEPPVGPIVKLKEVLVEIELEDVVVCEVDVTPELVPDETFVEDVIPEVVLVWLEVVGELVLGPLVDFDVVMEKLLVEVDTVDTVPVVLEEATVEPEIGPPVELKLLVEVVVVRRLEKLLADVVDPEVLLINVELDDEAAVEEVVVEPEIGPPLELKLRVDVVELKAMKELVVEPETGDAVVLVELAEVEETLVVPEPKLEVLRVLEAMDVLITLVRVVEPEIGPPDLLELLLEIEVEVLEPTGPLDVADEVEEALVDPLVTDVERELVENTEPVLVVEPRVRLPEALETVDEIDVEPDVGIEVMLEVDAVDVDPGLGPPEELEPLVEPPFGPPLELGLRLEVTVLAVAVQSCQFEGRGKFGFVTSPSQSAHPYPSS